MRSYFYLLIGLTLALFTDAATASRIPLNARQNGRPSSDVIPEPTTTARQTPIIPTTVQPAEPSLTAMSTNTASRIRTITEIATLQITSTAISNGYQPTSTAEAEPRLPIQPKLSPAIGMAGAILLITGAVYAVTGIRNKLLYIFFSSAYLASLAVTVLIVYLMSPPVSDAVQGGYFVAAFMTGVIFGVISLIFTDITDGLGCLLGGFCLSMWFLTVEEGGLIQSTTGRAIFIACMTVAAFGVSFSHYTKTYGLIVFMSFAGSTITILGIDCFSRAGLKEFWLYLWGLTPDSFPLSTTTYPLTRGIKAEIAGIVLLTAFGIISQLKLWNVVRRRQEIDAAERTERERNAQEEEDDVARRLRVTLKHGLAKWEKIYGKDAQPHDSVIDSSNKSSVRSSVKSSRASEKQVSYADVVEMKNLPDRHRSILRDKGTGAQSETQRIGPSVIVTYVSEEDEEIQPVDAHNHPVSTKTPSNTRHSAISLSSTRVSSNRASSERTPKSTSVRSSLRTLLPPTPKDVPLPFTVAQEEESSSGKADTASGSAIPDSEYGPAHTPRSPSKRGSGGSFLKRFSLSKAPVEDDSEEELIMSHIEDDRASSLAATMNDELDSFSGTEPTFELRTPVEVRAEPSINPADDSAGISTGKEKLEGVNKDGDKKEGGKHAVPDLKPEQDQPSPAPNSSGRKSLVVATEAISEATWLDGGAFNKTPRVVDEQEEKKSDQEDGSETATGSPAVSPGVREIPPVRLSKDTLPDRFSKVALSYRTNEWAKHLESAEQPALDDIPEPDSPGVKLLPVIVEPPGSAETNHAIVQPPKPKPNRTSSGTKLHRNSNLVRSTSHLSSRSSVGTMTEVLQSAASPQSKGMRRSTSGPLGSSQNLTTSSPPSRLSNTVSPIPSTTLLDKRESLLRNRASLQNLTPATSSTNLPIPKGDEDMTLAQRKQLLKQQPQGRPLSSSQSRRQSALNLNAQLQDFNSHQPRRTSTGVDPSRREVMLAGWRESMRQDGRVGQSSTPVHDIRSQRLSAINEKRMREVAEQERAFKEQQRESVMGNMMRSGEMLEAHREAMRRLQASANPKN